MKKYLTVITLLLLSFTTMAQKNVIAVEGRVVDEKEKGLMGATIVLLHQADSVIAKFNITNESGQFSLTKILPQQYILQITYIGYETYSQPIDLSTQKEKYALRNIQISPVSTHLNEVLISAEHLPMVMNGDTLEYNAAAFKVEPNSPVEELLKKLPGIEVARDGSIKAQGEKVTKVMVDGKEFFGSDPTIATKNLPADAIEKVQVFEKKSAQAEFSGIDDGKEQKTINLKLKTDKKHGYFGNTSGGYGTDSRYDGKFNLNRFGGKAQVSVIGMANNINKQGFSFDDYMNFMGGLSNFMSGGGSGMEIEIGGDEGGLPLALNGQNGLTNIVAGGVNVNSDLSKKAKLNTSYFYNHSKNTLDRSVSRRSLGGEKGFQSEELNKKTTTKTNHRLSLTFKHKIDSFQQLTFKNDASFTDAGRKNVGNTQTSVDVLENESWRNYQSTQNSLRSKGDFTYFRRFRKKGRFFTTKLSYQFREGKQAGTLYAINNFYVNNIADTTNQRQLYISSKKGAGITASFTEPMGKYKYLEFNFSRQQYKSTLTKDFYTLFSTLEIFDENLSNAFSLDYAYNQAGVSFRYHRKKLNFTSGVHFRQSMLKGNSLSENTTIPQTFHYFLPNVQVQYDFKSSSNFSINYHTDVREPTVRQLQPVIDNSSPLNIYKGNPDLIPAYGHQLSLFYMLYDQFNFTSFHVNVTGVYTKNKITTKQNITNTFVQESQPINVDDDFSLRGSIAFSTPLRLIKSRINLRSELVNNRSILFINNAKTDANIRSAVFDVSLDNRKKKIIDIAIGGNFKFNTVAYLDNKSFNQQFSQQTYYADFGVNMGKNWKAKTSFDYQVYSNEAFGVEQGIPLWEASVSAYMMKKKGELKLSVFDLLNKNRGINRVSQLNFTQEEQVKSLGRYFMLSFAYSISGFDKNHSGIHIKMTKQR